MLHDQGRDVLSDVGITAGPLRDGEHLGLVARSPAVRAENLQEAVVDGPGDEDAVVVGSRAREADEIVGGSVAPCERSEALHRLHLGHPDGEVEPSFEPDGSRDAREQLVDRRGAGPREHLADVLLGVRRVAHPRAQCTVGGRRWDGMPTFGPLARQSLEPVLRDEREVVALVEALAAHLRIAFPESSDLSVLLRDELLVQRGDLDVEVVLRQVEVRGELLDDVPVLVPLQVEGGRLVLPFDLIEVEESRELALAVVRESNGVAAWGRRIGRHDQGQAPPAEAAPRGFLPFVRLPSRSVATLSTAIANTPWPLERRSTTASGESTA